ncbi:MAG TPA: O-antigen ligase family protein [Gemmatimonadaceae bacterium]
MPERQSLVARTLPFLTWGLTFHILAIALLFGFFRMSENTVRAIAAWKEMFAVLVLIATIVRMARGTGTRNGVVAADLFAGGWIGLAVVFVLTENILWRDNISTIGAFLGLRDAAFFVLFYFVGRGTPEIGDDDRLLKRAFLVLAVVSAVAVLEQIFVTPRMLVAMGVASYVNTFLGTPLSTAGNSFGLPDNYWSLMGGHLVRRSGSVFLSSQGFATPFLVLLPAATMWLWGRAKSPTFWERVWYCVIWAGLLASFTRAVILICALQLLLAMVYLKRPTGAALIASLCLTALVGVMVAFPGIANFIFETITWQSGSSTSHLKDWTNGITAFFERPWGYGLGTADQTAQRVGLDPITADNMYLKYAVEMGVLGLIAIVGALTAFTVASVRLIQNGITSAQRALGVTVALATLGIAADGMTAVVFNNPIVAYLFFWFAGACVTLAQRSAPRLATAPMPALASHA